MLDAHFTAQRGQFNIEMPLHVEQEILVLCGPSGSGKTTILQCLSGLLKPVSGFIKLNGRVLFSDKEKINLPPRERNIGYVFQDYALFPHLTVKQNVTYGIKKDHRNSSLLDPLKLLHSFGIGHLAERYPGQISGGEKQRVALARALATQPELLLLDEPLCALDKDIRSTLRFELRKIHQEWQIPFILVTHDEEDAAVLGDTKMSLFRKRTAASGTAQQSTCSHS
ncbi:ATP-binding cassette domain-containing protein [Syntrophaceticus schinkii]|jgi:molybdate transport system ATP-binding protein|uniref:Molybdate-transporting ATPase n=1 Tax=Syntrophaceticus schinkii TaxID=499207 RepID=A0A0B7MC96_9FIRM|nr:ATP-binding cassette domain-containing protein [Syntrophaceticus schinkii]MDD2358892.1 ATP-binding cassette domain-containing protein [Syntrophaceticus schinkii]MDD4260944.1 ATP-binding cassette domain-containing protein [Syntrophaceticus schinkii]MDD4674080.1 ATP-binding cassette domain-containing protein [Syntrophaceticus schinkii]CEO88164.1 Molybdate-transporting ATPase [Syntrophaceticus schinkii]